METHTGRRSVWTVLAIVAMAAAAGAYVYWQSFGQDGVQAWYRASQGSRLLPATWFDALERPNGGGRFAEESHLTSFGYLAMPGSDGRQLPIGFTLDDQSDEGFRFTRRRWFAGQTPNEKWVGLNCSACHTGLVTYKGTARLIEGGQSAGDLQSFLEALNVSIKQTLDDALRFERFSKTVLGGQDNPQNVTMLRDALATHYEWLESTRKMNETPLRYGLGRVDAFGHIFNKAVVFANPEARTGHPSDAPVSYPFLWNTHKQRYVQYNGIAENSRLGRIEYGALGRNAGQVVGVFGEVVVRKNPVPGGPSSLDGYPSSINVNNLMMMERFVQALQPPKWPAEFPAIDTQKAKAGEALFEAHCATCHLTPDRQANAKSTETVLPITETEPHNRTDVWMACNAYTREASSGLLEGTHNGYVHVAAADPLQATAKIGHMLGTTVRGMLVAQKGDIIQGVVDDIFGTQLWELRGPSPAPRPEVFGLDVVRTNRTLQQLGCETIVEAGERKLLAYKARPLDGIWATAPYLHNGSVPSLRDLLLPAKDRPKTFWVSREFDPDTVGVAQTPPADALKSEFRTVGANGDAILGNSNAGHEYGANELGEADRAALLEYLKSL